MHLSMGEGGGVFALLGRDLINRFGPGVGHLNYFAVPGVGVFEFLFEPMTTNHFLGWEILVMFDLTFCLGVGNFAAIFWKMSNPRPMPRLSPSPPCRLDIDRCINCNSKQK